MPLVINDMGVISKIMVITETYVVSSNYAKSFTDSKNNGFMFFHNYVIHSEVRIDKWRLTYKNKTFNVYYTSKNNNGVSTEELLYSAIEIDKTSTYKIVIYIIEKAAKLIDEWTADNFIVETYELVVRNE